MVKLKQFDNGLKLVTESYQGLRSVSVGFWFGAGSGFENKENNGISHFTEHVMFKGTADLNSTQIAEKFEDYGASMNAFTSKEATCYYFKCIDERLEDSFALMAHILYHSTYDDDELNKERNVIIEEINMVEDAPDEICSDKLAEQTYAGTALSQTILGLKENVMRFKGDDVRAYVRKMYTPDNTVISIVGNIEQDRAIQLVEKYILPECGGSKCDKTYSPNVCGVGFSKYEKDFEQVNLAFAFPSLEYEHKDTPVQGIVSFCLGGGMSSRLFQVLREQKGLVYNVYSSPSSYKNNGVFGIYVNTSGKNLSKAVDAVRDEILRLKKERLTAEEIERAKAQIISGSLFSLENTLTTMNVYGKYTLNTGMVFDFDERIKRLKEVSDDEVNEFCNKIFDFEAASVAYVGKSAYIKNVDIFKDFTKI